MNETEDIHANTQETMRMIVLPTADELRELASVQDAYCVSIYAPYMSPNAANNPNRIELKNLLREAEAALAAEGVDQKTLHYIFRDAYALLGTTAFWPNQHAALAMFLRPRQTRYYLLPPDSVTQATTFGKAFDLYQLRHILEDNKPYYVLSLSHNGVKLFAGDRDALAAVKVKGIEGTMTEVLGIDEYPQARELHGVGPASLGKGSEGYHQQYNATETDKIMLLDFFRRIDSRLHTYLQRHKRPLILAGVSYLVPIYRKANTYPELLAQSIRGNVQRDTLDSIRKRAWRIIRRREQPSPA